MKNDSKVSLKNIVIISLFGVSVLAHAKNPVWYLPEPLPENKTGVTPHFVSLQDYLDPSPMGVGVKKYWESPGGRGQRVRIVDIETSVTERHEDFPSFVGIVNSDSDTDHGTAVSGILVGKDNGWGITGIANLAEFGFYGFKEGDLSEVDEQYIVGIREAIRVALSTLKPGDVLVMEQHMRGPDSSKWTAVEYWDEIFEELKQVTDKGVHCVAAAGNGGSDFDHPSYQGKFDINVRDSGCIVVGAGDRNKERLFFSNYGSRVDVFGYGAGVASTGYGDIFNGGTERLYTGGFSGTSSATPIVAGVVAVLSSMAEEKGVTISPKKMRQALRETGQRQGARTRGQRIGNFPNMDDLVKHFNLSM